MDAETVARGRSEAQRRTCLKCNDKGASITNLVTYCPPEGDMYAIQHWCDDYPFPEARGYLHGRFGGSTGALFNTPEEAWADWNTRNDPVPARRLFRRLKLAVRAILEKDANA